MKDEKKPLFSGWRYSSIEWNNRGVHAGEKEPASKRTAEAMKTAVLVCLAYLIWLSIHELMHYLACVSLGGELNVSSLLPNPKLVCDSSGYMTPGEAFIYTLTPYMLAVFMIAAAGQTMSRFLRLLSYAAFMDLQLNLAISTILSGVIKGKKNDAFYLLEYLDKVRAGFDVPMMLYIGFVALLVASSLIVFWRRVEEDLCDEGSRDYYRSGLVSLIILYALNTVLLFA